jgi:hypothetical protein
VSLAPLRSAPVRSAPLRSAPLRSALESFAPASFAPTRLASRRSAEERSAFVRTARHNWGRWEISTFRISAIGGRSPAYGQIRSTPVALRIGHANASTITERRMSGSGGTCPRKIVPTSAGHHASTSQGPPRAIRGSSGLGWSQPVSNPPALCATGEPGTAPSTRSAGPLGTAPGTRGSASLPEMAGLAYVRLWGGFRGLWWALAR